MYAEFHAWMCQWHVSRYPFLIPVLFLSGPPQKVQLNPEWSGGVRGTVWAEERMRHIIESGGVVESPLPCLPNIPRTYAIRWSIRGRGRGRRGIMWDLCVSCVVKLVLNEYNIVDYSGTLNGDKHDIIFRSQTTYCLESSNHCNKGHLGNHDVLIRAPKVYTFRIPLYITES